MGYRIRQQRDYWEQFTLVATRMPQYISLLMAVNLKESGHGQNAWSKKNKVLDVHEANDFTTAQDFERVARRFVAQVLYLSAHSLVTGGCAPRV